MLDPQTALAAIARPAAPPPLRPRRRVLVLGGGGDLGTAALEQLLGSHRFEQVGVLAGPALQPALRGLVPVADDAVVLAAFAPEVALIVFDRERHANGRDAAFVRAAPAELARWATRLHAAGVRDLVVALPHAVARLPQALRAGLASLDEAAVAALGFEHLVFMRLPQAGGEGAAVTGLPQRLAAWMLSQLQWLVPQHEQPVRAATVARVAAGLALALPDASPGTRVLPAELPWLAAQGLAVETLLADWLAGRALPDAAARRRW